MKISFVGSPRWGSVAPSGLQGGRYEVFYKIVLASTKAQGLGGSRPRNSLVRGRSLVGAPDLVVHSELCSASFSIDMFVLWRHFLPECWSYTFDHDHGHMAFLVVWRASGIIKTVVSPG